MKQKHLGENQSGRGGGGGETKQTREKKSKNCGRIKGSATLCTTERKMNMSKHTNPTFVRLYTHGSLVPSNPPETKRYEKSPQYVHFGVTNLIKSSGSNVDDGVSMFCLACLPFS